MTKNCVDVDVAPCTGCRFCRRAEIYKVASCLLDKARLLVTSDEKVKGYGAVRVGRLSQCPLSWRVRPLSWGSEIGSTKRVKWRVPLENLTKIEATYRVWRFRPKVKEMDARYYTEGDLREEVTIEVEEESGWGEGSTGEKERERRRLIRRCEEALERLEGMRERAHRNFNVHNMIMIGEVDRIMTAIRAKLRELDGEVPLGEERFEDVYIHPGRDTSGNCRSYATYTFDDSLKAEGRGARERGYSFLAELLKGFGRTGKAMKDYAEIMKAFHDTMGEG